MFIFLQPPEYQSAVFVKLENSCPALKISRVHDVRYGISLACSTRVFVVCLVFICSSIGLVSLANSVTEEIFPCRSPQVIQWIEEHGETFLKKHTGVGKSLVKAEALLKRHEEFENIAQVKQENHFSSSF